MCLDGRTLKVQCLVAEIVKRGIGLADLDEMTRPARRFLVEAVLWRIAELAFEAADVIASTDSEKGGGA